MESARRLQVTHRHSSGRSERHCAGWQATRSPKVRVQARSHITWLTASRKVGQVLFNPAAENILASAAGDYTVKIWDIESGSAKLSLKVGDVVQGLSWSANGSLLVTTSRDKKLRIWDARQEKPAHEGPSHAGAKNSRCVWLGEHDRIATTGFSRMSDRQLALWDIKAAREPVGGFEQLDSISGVCMPFWDEGTQCLYLAGKGDGNIRYFEYENDKFEYLSEYKSADPQRGVAFVPKRGVNMHENEVTRAYKTVNDAYIEPISFIVPRRSETFQDDIYPATVGLKPALSAAAWFEGKEGLPPKIDMQSLYDGDGMKEVPSDIQPAAAVAKAAKEEQVTKAQQVKDAEPLKTAEAAESAPIVTAIKGPPPSMKEQGATMMTAVDKYADKDGEREEEDDDASSFEEVQKPVERTTATRPATAKIEAAEPALTIEQPIPVEPEKPKDLQAHEDSVAAKETNVAPSSTSVGTPDESSGGIEREMKNMKAILAQQSRQISSQGEEIKKLTEQIQALTSKLQ